MSIKGFRKMSLVDYPDRICAVIFTGGCNFRCPFCQNPDLINGLEEFPDIDEKEILDYLKEKRDWLDGICITGGEPTIYKGLVQLIEKIKSMGFLVKLDTNGSNPEMLKELVGRKLLDYIAMDIKSSPERYSEASGCKVEMENIRKSVEIIRNSGIEYEFRTTVLPRLFSFEDAEKTGKWLKGSKRFFLQQFRPDVTLDRSFEKEVPYSEEKLKKLADRMRPFFKEVDIRN